MRGAPHELGHKVSYGALGTKQSIVRKVGEIVKIKLKLRLNISSYEKTFNEMFGKYFNKELIFQHLVNI